MNQINFHLKKVNLTNFDDVGENLGNFLYLRFQFQKNELSFAQIYHYPDEDICLFKHFPNDKLVDILEKFQKLIRIDISLEELAYDAFKSHIFVSF